MNSRQMLKPNCHICSKSFRGRLVASRYGFSLLEVSIAMLLGMFLMLAVFQSYFVSTRFRSSAMESSVRVSSLTNTLRDMSSDVISMNRPIRKPVGFGASIKPMKRTDSIQSFMSFNDSFSSANKLDWVVFRGNSDYVAFQAPASNSRFAALPPDMVPSSNCLVVWWVKSGTAPRVEGWLNDTLPAAKPLKDVPSPRGLVRTIIYTDLKGVEKQHSEMISSQVQSMDLKYYDGEKLSSTWRLNEVNALPRAIQVRLRLPDDVAEQWIEIYSSMLRGVAG